MARPLESPETADPPEVRRVNNAPSRSLTRSAQLLLVALAAIAIASIVSQVAAVKFGLQTGKPTYRRIGPTTGPQIFCAGSSLLQFGLAWPEVSAALGEGIQCWAIGGSSPEVWEASQPLATNANIMIVGFSVYDLNEEHLCDSRANVVPLRQSILNLWRLKAELPFCRRILSQYPLAWLRTLFPTAGKSDPVLVGLRRKLKELVGSSAPPEERANAMVLPSQPTLDFGGSTERLSDWPADKALRRLNLIRTEIHGTHRFNGLQQMALNRMLDYASKRGRVIVVVMPVAPSYANEFLTPDVERKLEQALGRAKLVAPQAEFVRLDQVPMLKSNTYYSDFIHLNGAGRTIATDVFLREISQHSREP
jgi:hypothetical protein